jgi:hypothetical protein
LWWDGKTRRFASRADLAKSLLLSAKRDDGGKPKTGRRYYYLAISHGYISPDMSDSRAGKRSRDAAYDAVIETLGKLRMMGELGWDMVLDLTRELTEWKVFTSPREARAEMRATYDEDRWLGQPYYPVLVVEKDTLVPTCEPMAMRWQMPFASSRGYSSLRLQYDVARMLNERYARTGQPALVYFVSDLDPSGPDLQRAWEDALANFAVPVEFVRLALTREQVDQIDNARLRRGIEVKPSDSRAKGYVAQYGNRCWEADILPAQVIEQALDDHIRSWLDVRRWNERQQAIERARGSL